MESANGSLPPNASTRKMRPFLCKVWATQMVSRKLMIK